MCWYQSSCLLLVFYSKQFQCSYVTWLPNVWWAPYCRIYTENLLLEHPHSVLILLLNMKIQLFDRMSWDSLVVVIIYLEVRIKYVSVWVSYGLYFYRFYWHQAIPVYNYVYSYIYIFKETFSLPNCHLCSYF